MRYGTPLWFDPPLTPSYIRPQRSEKNHLLKARVKEKTESGIEARAL
jgi:hypothetical protein